MLVESFKAMSSGNHNSVIVISHQERIMQLADTMIVIADGKVAATPDRRTLFLAQTPQAFSRAEYFAAMADAKAQGLDFTDDAQLFELTGRPVHIVEGHFDNLKITTPEDVPLAEGCLRAMRGE